jgi:hypothetical protein
MYIKTEDPDLPAFYYDPLIHPIPFYKADARGTARGAGEEEDADDIEGWALPVRRGVEGGAGQGPARAHVAGPRPAPPSSRAAAALLSPCACSCLPSHALPPPLPGARGAADGRLPAVL